VKPVERRVVCFWATIRCWENCEKKITRRRIRPSPRDDSCL